MRALCLPVFISTFPRRGGHPHFPDKRKQLTEPGGIQQQVSHCGSESSRPISLAKGVATVSGGSPVGTTQLSLTPIPDPQKP